MSSAPGTDRVRVLTVLVAIGAVVSVMVDSSGSASQGKTFTDSTREVVRTDRLRREVVLWRYDGVPSGSSKRPKG